MLPPDLAPPGCVQVYTDQGPKGLRWLRRRDESDRRLCYEPPPPDRAYHSVAELMCLELRRALAPCIDPALRLVGHSTGAQLVVHAAALLASAAGDAALVPRRVVLLDPFCSRGAKPYAFAGPVPPRAEPALASSSQPRS